MVARLLPEDCAACGAQLQERAARGWLPFWNLRQSGSPEEALGALERFRV